MPAHYAVAYDVEILDVVATDVVDIVFRAMLYSHSLENAANGSLKEGMDSEPLVVDTLALCIGGALTTCTLCGCTCCGDIRCCGGRRC